LLKNLWKLTVRTFSKDKFYIKIAEIANCRKQGAWKKRIEFLVEIVGIMKNICLKANSDTSGY